MKKTALTAAVLWALPVFAFAQSNDINGLISKANGLLNSLIPLLMVAALVVFFWGLVQYVMGAGEGNHEKGRNIIVAGVIALFVMATVWGLVRFLQNSLGISGNEQVNIPQIPAK